MKIVVCYKLVPSAESLTVKSGRQLDFGSAEWEIGPYDLNAVEAAARLKEASADNSLIALTFGGDIIENSKLSTVRALQSIGYETIAAGDSYNDLAMIQASKAGFLFRSTEKIKQDYPELPAFDNFDDLLSAIKQELK